MPTNMYTTSTPLDLGCTGMGLLGSRAKSAVYIATQGLNDIFSSRCIRNQKQGHSMHTEETVCRRDEGTECTVDNILLVAKTVFRET